MNYTVVINCFVWFGALGMHNLMKVRNSINSQLAYYYIDARKWFTGPKITLNTDELTEEQAQALSEEGLDISPANPVKGTGEEAAVELNGKETHIVS